MLNATPREIQLKCIGATRVRLVNRLRLAITMPGCRRQSCPVLGWSLGQCGRHGVVG